MTTLLFLMFIGLLLFGVFRTIVSSGWDLGFHPLKGVPFFLGSLVPLLVLLSFVTVYAGDIGVVQRFGKPVAQLNPGAHLVMPFADVVYPVSINTHIVKPSESAASHDLQIVNVEVTFAYHVDSRFATEILVGLNNDPETRVITPAILESIKAVTARYDVKELVSQRPTVRDNIEELVKQRLIPYHVVAENVSITNFSFSKEFENSIEAKVVAEQNAEKAKNDLTRIQIQAEQQIAQAKGEAEALRAQKEQITPKLLQLRTIEMMKEKWNGQLPDVIVGGSSALPMMDVLNAARAAKHQ